jgi:hypothetical protein
MKRGRRIDIVPGEPAVAELRRNSMHAQTQEATWSVLNPIGERESESQSQGINPRLDTLDGKTIGLFDSAKRSCPYVLGKVEKLLQERFPAIKISWFRKQTYKDVVWDEEREWASGVDGVIGMFGD